MTLKELSQLYYLNREIEMDQRRIDELRAKAESVSPPLGMPHNQNRESKIERYVADIVDLTAIIAAKQQQCIHERNRLERYIAEIEDSLTRQIFTYRFVNGLGWEDVASNINEKLTGKYVSNICYSQLKKDEFEEKQG